MNLTSLPFPMEEADKPVFVEKKIPEELKTKIQEAIEIFAENYPEFENILVATIDGFDIASQLKNSDHDSIHRIAAISSSMLSLSIEILSEMSVGEQKILTLEGENGSIFISQVSPQRFMMSLTVITMANESLGQFLWLLKQLKGEIEKICDSIEISE